VLVHTIPGDSEVLGVTSLDNELFVVRYNSQQVQVYDVTTFTLSRSLQVPGLRSSWDALAVCGSNKCLYVSDSNNSCVHRVELTGSIATMKWSVAANPAGLFVTNSHNVLVTCHNASKLQEYTTRGTSV
jgi:hypothetical protein